MQIRPQFPTDKDLLDGTHAKSPALNSFISIPGRWLPHNREKLSVSLCLKPNIDLFNSVRKSKFTNLLSMVYEAVSRELVAPA